MKLIKLSNQPFITSPEFARPDIVGEVTPEAVAPLADCVTLGIFEWEGEKQIGMVIGDGTSIMFGGRLYNPETKGLLIEMGEAAAKQEVGVPVFHQEFHLFGNVTLISKA